MISKGSRMNEGKNEKMIKIGTWNFRTMLIVGKMEDAIS